MNCPDCGYENPEGALSCGLCQRVIKKERPKDLPANRTQDASSFIGLSAGPPAAGKDLPPPAGAGAAGSTGIPYGRIAEEMVASSKGTDPFLGGFGVLLDWQPSSIWAIDRFMDHMWGEEGESPQTETYNPSKGKNVVIMQVGSYFGEVARRLWGGEWREDPNNLGNPNWTMLAFPDNQGFFPIAKVFKRFKNGPEDALFPLLRMMLQQRPRPAGDLGFLGQAGHFLTRSHLPPELGKKLAAQCFRLAAELDPARKAEAEAKLKALGPGA